MPASVTQIQLTAERVARNQATFREANEKIQQAALEYDVDGKLPFICECSEQDCVEIVRLRLADYESVRATPTHFITAPGHHRAAEGWANLLERRDGYEISEKVGDAADLAEELDPRSQ
jgi:hypothetical protein